MKAGTQECVVYVLCYMELVSRLVFQGTVIAWVNVFIAQ